jgi:hypothetical protein
MIFYSVVFFIVNYEPLRAAGGKLRALAPPKATLVRGK